jgi:hypothetical protein
MILHIAANAAVLLMMASMAVAVVRQMMRSNPS